MCYVRIFRLCYVRFLRLCYVQNFRLCYVRFLGAGSPLCGSPLALLARQGLLTYGAESNGPACLYVFCWKAYHALCTLICVNVCLQCDRSSPSRMAMCRYKLAFQI